MNDPKQGLTKFGDLYQFIAAAAREFLSTDDLATLRDLQQKYSIHTLEELVALARVVGREKLPSLEKIGVSDDLIHRVESTLKESEAGKQLLSEMEGYEQEHYSRGCKLDSAIPSVYPTVEDPTSSASPLREGEFVNLIDDNMPEIGDQGDRETCVSFVVTACLEYHLSRFCDKPKQDLSKQFHYWKMLSSSSDGKANLVSGFPILQNTGVCSEETWSYNSKLVQGDLADGPPPAAAVREASGYRCKTVQPLPPNSDEAIRDQLRKGRLVGIAVLVYNSWFNSGAVRKHGNITMPLPEEEPMGEGHAMTLVGFVNDSDYPGGGYFIVRNSWGDRWGTESKFRPGYGTLPYRYIRTSNRDAQYIVFCDEEQDLHLKKAKSRQKMAGFHEEAVVHHEEAAKHHKEAARYFKKAAKDHRKAARGNSEAAGDAGDSEEKAAYYAYMARRRSMLATQAADDSDDGLVFPLGHFRP
jgi:hypothetical protein